MRTLRTIAAAILVVLVASGSWQTAWAQGSEPAEADPVITDDRAPDPDPDLDPDLDEDPFAADGVRPPSRNTSLNSGREAPLNNMNEDELREVGFVFSDRDRSDLDSTGTVLALTLGSAVHGIGHLYVGDTNTGVFLLIMEAVSIVSMIGAGSYALLSGNADAGVVASSALFKFGASTFFASWVLDILGTLQGEDLVFALNRGPERGLSATIGYRLVDVAETPMAHGFDAGLDFDNDWLILGANTTQDVLLKFQQYGGVLGTRPLISGSRLSWLGAQVDGSYSRYSGIGEFGQFDVNARINWSAGLSAISPSFEQLSLGGSVGWGRRYLQIPDATNTLSFTDSRGRFLLDLFGELGVTDRLSARIGYRTSDGVLLPAPSPLVGITYFNLIYRSDGFGDLLLGAAISDGLMLHAGGRLWLWR